MKIQRLQTRFLIASCLLVGATVISGIFSVLTLANLSRGLSEILLESQESIDLASHLSSALEREDDALLLAIKGDVSQARKELETQRRDFDESYPRLLRVLNQKEERDAAISLVAHVESYRSAGDSFLLTAHNNDAHERYHLYVNPILRKAVSDCSRIRELNFRAMKLAGLRAQDVVRRSTTILILLSILALAVSMIVSFHLVRKVEKPIREMTRIVDGLRLGDFDRRIQVTTSDELGRLGEGFNRMAETLAEFRRVNLSEVLRAKQTLETTLAALPDAVIVVRADGTFESLNPRARSVLRAMGKETAVHLEEIGLTSPGLDAIQKALRGERTTEIRWELAQSMDLAIDGRLRKLLPMTLPIGELSKGQRGAILVLYDVTDYARLDELRSELIAAASHELRTPLTTLRMNLLLLRENSAEFAVRHLKIIEGAILGCEDLARTVDELLDLTRIEAQQLRLNLERVDLLALVTLVVNSIQARFEDAGITLRVETETNEPLVLRADSTRFRIVLSNLLDNALKYTPNRGLVTVRLSSRPNADAAGGHLLQITTTDSGPGIPEKFRERVFEKFFRVEHELSAKAGQAKGAGIGLYLCQQIVQAHGGSIRCETGPGGIGTQFAIELPAEIFEQ